MLLLLIAYLINRQLIQAILTDVTIPCRVSSAAERLGAENSRGIIIGIKDMTNEYHLGEINRLYGILLRSTSAIEQI